MYLPAHFAVTDRAQLHGLMAAHPLATVVMQDGDGLSANHLPLVLDGKAGEWGVLRGHVARGNPLAAADGSPVLVIFHGPQTYVSPGDYATKAVDGRVVPTWNYAVVHAHGVLRTYPDAEWIRAQVGALTSEHEGARSRPGVPLGRERCAGRLYGQVAAGHLRDRNRDRSAGGEVEGEPEPAGGESGESGGGAGG